MPVWVFEDEAEGQTRGEGSRQGDRCHGRNTEQLG